MNILAVTSHVVYGHVGGQAAILPLQRAGHEVWHLPTVLFSNHPGHGGFAGEATAPELVRRLLGGLAERGFLAQVDAVLSGYLGGAGTALALAETVAALKAARPVLYCCDPVLGDHGRRYVAEGVEAAIREALLPQADILTPNRHELGWLAGSEIASMADALAAARRLRARGAGSVVCTSAEERGGKIVSAVVGAGGAFTIEQTLRERVPYGTGDLFAALFLAARLAGAADGAALARAAGGTAAAIETSLAAGADELAVVAAQDAVLEPARLPAVRRIDGV